MSQSLSLTRVEPSDLGTRKAEELFTKAEKLEEKGALKEAHEALIEAANLGHTGAQVTLGKNFSSGRGVPESRHTAAYWYTRAYRAGDESGALNLAIDKLQENKERSAILWFNRACTLGSGEAALQLARIYLGKRRGKAKAVQLLETIQRMKRSQVSDDAKEEAAALFEQITAAP